MTDLRYIQQELAHLQDENRDLKDEVSAYKQYVTSIQTLMNAVDQMDPNAEVMPLLEHILGNALRVINAEDGSLLILDEQSGELVFVLSQGQIPQEHLVGLRIPPGKGIAGWVAKNARPVIANNAPSDDRFYSGIDTQMKYQTNSVLAAPMTSNAGRVLGVVEMLNKRNGAPFNETDQALLMLLCRFAGEVLNIVSQRDEASAAES